MTQDRSADFSGGLHPRDFSPNAGTPPSLLITSWSRHAAKSAWYSPCPAVPASFPYPSAGYAGLSSRTARDRRAVESTQSRLFSPYGKNAGKRIETGSAADRFIPVVFAGQAGENTFHHARQRRLKVWSLYTLPREMTQNARSDVSGHNLTGSGAARYFDYGSAVALRNLAAAYGTDMPRYLLAPEVAVLLSKVTDLRKRLFIDALWNTGGRLNEILPLAREDFALDDPLTGAPLASPFVVLRTLKQRRLEEAARSRSRRRGRPTKAEQQAERDVQAEIRDNPPRAVPLTDPGFVQRLREWFATAQLPAGSRLWDIRSEDTARSWISQAVAATARDGVTFSIRPVTPKTFRDSFAMHLVQHQVPQKVIQMLMGHKDAKSTEWYTRVFALDVTRQLGVRFSMDPGEAAQLLLQGCGVSWG